MSVLLLLLFCPYNEVNRSKQYWTPLFFFCMDKNSSLSRELNAMSADT